MELFILLLIEFLFGIGEFWGVYLGELQRLMGRRRLGVLQASNLGELFNEFLGEIFLELLFELELDLMGESYLAVLFWGTFSMLLFWFILLL